MGPCDCCGQTKTCCDPPPDSVTISGSGESHTLPSNGYNSWLLRGVFYGDFETVQLGCENGIYRLVLSYEPGSPCALGSATYEASTQHCDPFELTFDGVDFCGTIVDITATV